MLGQRGIFLTAAALTLLGLLIIAIASRTSTKDAPNEQLSATVEFARRLSCPQPTAGVRWVQA